MTTLTPEGALDSAEVSRRLHAGLAGGEAMRPRNDGDIEQLHYEVSRVIQYCLLSADTEIRLG